MSSVMPVEKHDYAVNRRLLMLSVIALGIGALSTVAADVLVNLIRFFTNLFFYQTLSLAERSPANHALGAAWRAAGGGKHGDHAPGRHPVAARPLRPSGSVFHEESRRERLRGRTAA
ncbi:hypothetical protein AU476_33560 [Cupriavidus sp. UYMSc13B]|nr:hypothetical protein AU476_33560 [Cupriavidus sp. UYMSc13B]